MNKKGVFNKTKYFIIDMDGTFYLGNKLIDGSDDFIRSLRASGRDFFFFTNNSSNSVKRCCDKLNAMGFPVGEEKIIISSHVTVGYLKREHPGKSVYLLGNGDLYDYFRKSGIRLTDENPDIVVLGFDTELTYERINKAANFIDGGALYIATHPDFNCPVEGGFMPDTGSMIEMFAASTGKRPIVMGKPMTETVTYLTELLSCEKDELAFVGDRIATDIKIGFDHDIPSALVLSGVTSAEEYEKSEVRASVVAERLFEIIKYI